MDFTVSVKYPTYAFRCDILSDVIAWLMVLSGVHRLARIDVGAAWRRAISRAVVLVWCVLPGVVAGHFKFAASPLWDAFEAVLSYVDIACALAFAQAMILLTHTAGLERCERSWRLSRGLLLAFCLLPAGAMQLLTWLFRLLDLSIDALDVVWTPGGWQSTVSLGTAWFLIPFGIAGVLGWLHSIISLWRTRRDAIKLRDTVGPWWLGPLECRTCGYALDGLTSQRCPECGETFLWLSSGEAAQGSPLAPASCKT